MSYSELTDITLDLVYDNSLNTIKGLGSSIAINNNYVVVGTCSNSVNPSQYVKNKYSAYSSLSPAEKKALLETDIYPASTTKGQAIMTKAETRLSEERTGAVCVYEKNGNEYNKVATLLPDPWDLTLQATVGLTSSSYWWRAHGDYFGNDVAINGDYIFVSSPYSDLPMGKKSMMEKHYIDQNGDPIYYSVNDAYNGDWEKYRLFDKANYGSFWVQQCGTISVYKNMGNNDWQIDQLLVPPEYTQDNYDRLASFPNTNMADINLDPSDPNYFAISDDKRGTHRTNFGKSISTHGDYLLVGREEQWRYWYDANDLSKHYKPSMEASKHLGGAELFKKNEDGKWIPIRTTKTTGLDYDAIQAEREYSVDQNLGRYVSLYGDFAVVAGRTKILIFKKDRSSAEDRWPHIQTIEADVAVNGSQLFEQVSQHIHPEDPDSHFISISVREEYLEGDPTDMGAILLYKKKAGLDEFEVINGGPQRPVSVVNKGSPAAGNRFRHASFFNRYVAMSTTKWNEKRGGIMMFKRDRGDDSLTFAKMLEGGNDSWNKNYGYGFNTKLFKNTLFMGEWDLNDSDPIGKFKIYHLTGDDNSGAPTPEEVIADSSAKLKDLFNLEQAIIDSIKNIVGASMASVKNAQNQDIVGRKRPTISLSIKNSIINNNGVEDTKANIKQKQKHFMKILFARNQDAKELTLTASDIGLDKTLNLGENKQVKENVLVVKKNRSDAISVSSEVSADTALYADLDRVNDSVKIDVGLVDPVTITKTRMEDEANNITGQWTVSLGSESAVKEEGENVTVNGVTIYIGSMYVDGTNLGINPNGLTDLASTGIPFIQGTTTVAPLDDIRNRRSLVLKNIFDGELGATSLTATAVHLGLDKTVGDNVRTNVKVFPADSAIDLTSDIDSDEGGYVDLSNVGHFALIQGISNEDFRIQVTQVDPVKKYMVKNSDGTVDVLPDEFENGDKFTIYNKTFYLGGVYTSNINEGLVIGEMNDLSTLKIRFANVGTTGVQSNITTIDSLSNIRANRHTAIRNLWKENSSVTNFKTKTQDLGLDITVGKLIKKNVVVYKANSELVDLTPTSSIIDNKTGVYGDLKELGDYVDFTTGTGGAFRVKVNTTNPKTYVITNTVNDTKLLEPEFVDGQWITFRGVTLYFGGVYTSGTNDGITAADPYVFPINGNPYKLPDENANYCLYADNNTFITGTVSQLSKEKQEEMREWVIDRLGSDTNNGASLVTDGFFYSNLHINTTVGELVLDMESKVCNSNNVQGFKVKVNNSRDNTYLFKGEHKTTATISWEADGNIMSVDVDFFENPQIRNGIRMNTVVTKSNPIGLLVDDYEPSLLCVENSKNKLSMYNKLVNSLELGKRVKDDKLNLQKQGELWSRHNL